MPPFITTIISALGKTLSEGWGSTLRYHRTKGAKEAALNNLRRWLRDQLSDSLIKAEAPKDKAHMVLDAFEKAWKEYDKDGILKG